jgi:uncharacterized integral membrane protein
MNGPIVVIILLAVVSGAVFGWEIADRLMDDCKARRDADRFDVFTEGKWRE